jgi:arginase family enzyme
MDLVEVNPYLDASRRTAVLAARTILEALSAVFDPDV